MVAQDPCGHVRAWCERQRLILLGIRTWGPNVGAMSAMYVHGRARTKLSRAMDALESQSLRGICLCGSLGSSTRCRHADTRGGVHYAGQVQVPSHWQQLLGNYGGLPRFTPSNYTIWKKQKRADQFQQSPMHGRLQFIRDAGEVESWLDSWLHWQRHSELDLKNTYRVQWLDYSFGLFIFINCDYSYSSIAWDWFGMQPLRNKEHKWNG